MAELARRTSELFGIPIAAQVEVADALGHGRCAFIVKGSDDGQSSEGWNTATVAAAQCEYLRSRGIRSVILVAGPFHAGRAKWCYEAHGMKAYVAPRAEPLWRYQDSELVHWVARNALQLPVAWLRELLARIDFVRRGWM